MELQVERMNMVNPLSHADIFIMPHLEGTIYRQYVRMNTIDNRRVYTNFASNAHWNSLRISQFCQCEASRKSHPHSQT